MCQKEENLCMKASPTLIELLMKQRIAHSRKVCWNQFIAVNHNTRAHTYTHTYTRAHNFKWDWSQSCINARWKHTGHISITDLSFIIFSKGFNILNPTKWAECVYFYHFYYSHHPTLNVVLFAVQCEMYVLICPQCLNETSSDFKLGCSMFIFSLTISIKFSGTSHAHQLWLFHPPSKFKIIIPLDDQNATNNFPPKPNTLST